MRKKHQFQIQKNEKQFIHSKQICWFFVFIYKRKFKQRFYIQNHFRQIQFAKKYLQIQLKIKIHSYLSSETQKSIKAMKRSIKNTTLNFNSITYRNAIYQGFIDSQKQSRSQFGIMYIAKSHQFICCSNWYNDNLQGQSLFYNDHKQYIYGTWINNKPQGFNVFRIQQIVLMAFFDRGRINKNEKILIIYQKYNLAFVLNVNNDAPTFQQLQFEIYTKQEVYSTEDVHRLFGICQWPSRDFSQNQTLIKYLSTKFISSFSNNKSQKQSTNDNPVKLRLISNKYYRFGYDKGLAIVFDQDYNRISVGYHVKSRLESFGIVYQQNSKKDRKVSQGIFYDENKLITRKQNSMNKNQDNILGKIYKTNLLMGVNFCNKFYKNPSQLYFYHINSILKQEFMRDLIAGSITTRRLLNEQSLNFSKIDHNQSNNQPLIQQSFLRKNQIQNIQPILFDRQTQKTDLIQRKNKFVKDRLRLQEIKKEIYDSIQRRSKKTQSRLKKEEYQRNLIHRQIIGNDKDKQYDEKNYFTPQKSLSKSRSRRRIFEESQKNLRLLKDFSRSKSENNLTPFKTKMKNRIFNKQTVQSIRQYINRQPNKVTNKKSVYNQPENNRLHDEDNRFNSYSSQRKYRAYQQKTPSQNYVRQDNRNVYGNKDIYQSRQSQMNKNPQIILHEPFIQSRNRSNKQSRQQKNKQYADKQFLNIENYHESRRRVTFQQNDNQLRNSQFKENKNIAYVPINSAQQIMKKKYNHQKDNKRYKYSRNGGINLISAQKHQNLNSTYNQSLNKFNKTRNKANQINLSTIQINQNDFPRQQENQQEQQRIQRHLSYTDSLQNKKYSKSKNQSTKQKINREAYQLKSEQNTFNPRSDNVSFNRQAYYHHKSQENYQKSDSYNKNSRQNTFQPRQNNYLAQQDQNNLRRSAFKHSNDIYLNPDIKQQKSYDKNRTQQFNRSTTKEENRQNQSKKQSSYMNKYHMKKSIEKQIQRSPDRHRCYGKDANKPYLENQSNTNKYSRQHSYLNNSYNNKGYSQYESPQKRNGTQLKRDNSRRLF